MNLQSRIQLILDRFDNDHEEALLFLYFKVRDTVTVAFKRKVIEDYNSVVKRINEQDPHKHYKEMMI